MRTIVGDIFEIPLTNNKKGYAHLVKRSKQDGDLFRVFKLIVTNEEIPKLKDIVNYPLMFPPVYSSGSAAVNYHHWKIIGNVPVKGFQHPKFISTLYRKDKTATIWFVYDGNRSERVGSVLPNEMHNLEFMVAYSPDLIANRIISGKKPYDSLIRTNILTDDPTKP